MAEGRALYEVMDDAAKYREASTAIVERVHKMVSANKPTGPWVMLSYQWDNKQVVMAVGDRLKAEGIATWIDEDQMSAYGSLDEAMADAVENSKARPS